MKIWPGTDIVFRSFNGALSSGFTDMFIKINNREIFPKAGPCSVNTLKELYARTNDGTMDDGNGEVVVHGRQWFFCHPKVPTSNSKCTIL